MLIHVGTQERIVAETTVGAGITDRQGSITSDSLIATLWVDSVTSGTLSVDFYTLTDTGKELLLFSFPTVVTGTVNLLLKKAGVSLQRFHMVATYSGICSYEIYVRAVEGSGESSVRILGSGGWRVSQTNANPVAGVLIPASLVDRAGVLVKNWSTVGTVFIADSIGDATTAVAYPLAPKDALALDIASGAAVYAITDGPVVDCRIAESGG